MSYIDVDKFAEKICNFQAIDEDAANAMIWLLRTFPTADVVEVRADYNVGDFCLYGFTDGNKSLAIVEIVKILDDTKGIAEVKFHKVIKDNTGNGFFHYLFKSGGTMNASFKYLKNITPKTDGERIREWNLSEKSLM